MFALAWIFLADQPEYRTGLIIVGLARCIAMVLIWNDLARGRQRGRGVAGRDQLALSDRRLLVARLVLPDGPARACSGSTAQGFEVSHLGSRAHRADLPRHPARWPATSPARIGIRRGRRAWYEEQFLPRIGPIALYGLLFTIVMLFALQGDAITCAAARRRADRDSAARLLPRDVLRRRSGWARRSGSATRGPARSPSPPHRTTSSSRSPSPSACSARRPARRLRASSVR